MKEKITPSLLRRRAKELIRKNEMPSLEDVLKAVAESREKFADKIKGARKTASKRKNR